jgi:hypothetical protein
MRVPHSAIPDRSFPPLRVFTSYSSLDSVMAGSLARALEAQGCDVFVAHDDLEAGTQFQDEIVAALRTADLFLPLLTTSFAGSNWTAQETGMALALQKFIIPLRVDINPVGFIARVQALQHDATAPHRTARSILALSARQPHLRVKGLDHLTTAFKRALTFDAANELAELIENLGALSSGQAADILAAGAFNGQVANAWRAAPFVERVATNHPDAPVELLHAYANSRWWRESEGREGVPPGQYEEWMHRAIQMGERGDALVATMIRLQQEYEPEDSVVH